MRVFKIPYDLKREEKIFGGYLSLRQVLYLSFIALSVLIFFIPISKIISFIVISILSVFFLLCAFFKVNEQNFDKLFFYALKFLFRKKRYIYGRCLEE